MEYWDQFSARKGPVWPILCLKLVRYSNSCTKHDSSNFSETAVDKQSGRQLDMCRIHMPLRTQGNGKWEGVFYLSLWYVYKAFWAFIQKLKRTIMLGDGISMVICSVSLELIIHLFVTEGRKETELWGTVTKKHQQTETERFLGVHLLQEGYTLSWFQYVQHSSSAGRTVVECFFSSTTQHLLILLVLSSPA